MAKKPGSKGAAVAAKAKAGSKKQQKDTSQGSKTGSSSKTSSSKAGSSSKASGLRDPLDRELALLGLRVKSITADGNCFFRALSDQLQGDEALHSDLRCRVVALISERADDFAPFVEDDQSLDAYLARMRREGVWAGHMELQAASLLLEANIAVYQAGQPRWCITNHPPDSRMLHVSYHDGEHYNSVRQWDDYSRGSPADIPDSLAPIADTAQVQQCWSAVDEKRVAEGTGCDNPLLVQQQLQACGGDVEAAIEAVIEIMAGEGDVEPGEPIVAAAGAEEGHAAAAAAAAVGEGGGVAGSQPSVATVGQEQQGQGESGVSEALLAAAAAAGSGEGSPTRAPDEGSSSREQQEVLAAAAAAAGSGEDGQTQASSTRTAAGTDGAADSSNKGSSSSSKARGVRLKGAKSSSSSKGVSGGPRRGGDKAEKAPSRNKSCPCGSGRKHKVCCGAPGAAQKGGKAAAEAANEGLPAALATLHI